MKIGIGMIGMILGVIGIVVGGAMYAADWHHTIGTYGAVLGVVLLVLGAVYWMMMERKKPGAPMQAATPAQPAQPASP
jgi:uncharacterized membrane protein YdjX (TVP38/TMEM64 family)